MDLAVMKREVDPRAYAQGGQLGASEACEEKESYEALLESAKNAEDNKRLGDACDLMGRAVKANPRKDELDRYLHMRVMGLATVCMRNGISDQELLALFFTHNAKFFN